MSHTSGRTVRALPSVCLCLALVVGSLLPSPTMLAAAQPRLPARTLAADLAAGDSMTQPASAAHAQPIEDLLWVLTSVRIDVNCGADCEGNPGDYPAESSTSAFLRLVEPSGLIIQLGLTGGMPKSVPVGGSGRLSATASADFYLPGWTSGNDTPIWVGDFLGNGNTAQYHGGHASLGFGHAYDTQFPLPARDRPLDDQVFAPSVTAGSRFGVGFAYNGSLTITGYYKIAPLPAIDAVRSTVTVLNAETCGEGEAALLCLPAGSGEARNFGFLLNGVDLAGYPYKAKDSTMAVTRSCGGTVEAPRLVNPGPFIGWNQPGQWTEFDPGLYRYDFTVDGVALASTATVSWYGTPDAQKSHAAAAAATLWTNSTPLTLTVTARDACGQAPFGPPGALLPMAELTFNALPPATVPPSSYQAPFDAAGVAHFNVPVTAAARYSVVAKAVDANVTLLDQPQLAAFNRGAIIAGRVTRADGAGMPNIHIHLASAAHSYDATTDSAGFYHSDIAAGTYTLTPSSGHNDTFSPATRSVTVSAPNGGAVAQDFTVIFDAGTPRVFGFVMSELSGAPLQGVTIQTEKGKVAETNASGAFVIDLAAGTHTIRPYKKGTVFTPPSMKVTLPPAPGPLSFKGRPEPALIAWPASAPDGGTPNVTVRLQNGPPNTPVSLLSSRMEVDVFTARRGMTDAQGRFETTMRSRAAGVSLLRVLNETTNQTLDTSATVTFTGDTTPPEGKGPVITEVKPRYSLNDAYIQGVPAPNLIKVQVDWGQEGPKLVRMVLNGHSVSQLTDGSGASFTINMGQGLPLGENRLSFVAVDAKDQVSPEMVYRPKVVQAPGWLLAFLRSELTLGEALPGDVKLATSGYTAAIQWPLQPLGADAFFPAGPAPRFEANAEGRIKVPISCKDAVAASLKGKLTFQVSERSKIEGSSTASLEAPRSYCLITLPTGSIAGSVEGSYRFYEKPFLTAIFDWNPYAATALYMLLKLTGLRAYLTKAGVIFIDGKTHGDMKATLFSPENGLTIWPSDLNFGGGLGVEGGFEARMKAAEMKVTMSGDGSIAWQKDGPLEWPPLAGSRFDKVTLAGAFNYLFRYGDRMFKPRTYGFEWVYPPQPPPTGSLLAASDADYESLTLIPHMAAPGYAAFDERTSRPAFASMGEDALALAERPATPTQSAILVSNVYTYSEPSLALHPLTDKAVLLWVHDDLAKEVGQSHEIAYSLWDGSAWSTPAPVTNDTLSDGAPAVAWANDGKAVALWQRLTEMQTITTTWSITLARSLKIASATYAPGAGWSTPELVAGTTGLQQAPVLARAPDGRLLAAWRANAAGEPEGNAAHPDSLMAAFYDRGWSPAAAVRAGLEEVSELAAGYGQGGAAMLAYTRLITPTGAVTPTMQLFTLAWDGSGWSEPVRQSDLAVDANTQPQIIYNAANQPLLIWLAEASAGAPAGGTIRMKNLATGAVRDVDLADAGGGSGRGRRFVDEFRALGLPGGDVAVVLRGQAGKSDLYVARFDAAADLWGQPMPLTQDRAQERYPTAAVDGQGRLLMAYTRNEVVASQAVTTTRTGTYTYTMWSDLPSDLMTLSHRFTGNLTLGEGDLQTSALPATPGAQPAGTFTVTATVHNTGDLPLAGGAVAFYDGNPAQGGVLFSGRVLSGTLAAGASDVFTVIYSPVTAGPHTLYAVADPFDGVAESDEADNTGRITLAPDLALEAAGPLAVAASEFRLGAVVSNAGPVDAVATTAGLLSRGGRPGRGHSRSAGVGCRQVGRGFRLLAAHCGACLAGNPGCARRSWAQRRDADGEQRLHVHCGG